MKAISIRQPWPFAILHLGKRIENRPKPWHYRGVIAIHASGMRLRKNGQPTAAERADVENAARFIQSIVGNEQHGAMTWGRIIVESGAIVGTARIVDCVTASASPWFVGPYGLVLEDVRPTPVIPCRGALGLWTVPPEVERRIREAL